MSEPLTTEPAARPVSFYALSPAEQTARRRRNVWIALGLVAFMILLFTTTLLRMNHNQAEARRHAEAAIAAGAVAP
jgi:uncharacterized membrane protein